jgi:hypothetical protein
MSDQNSRASTILPSISFSGNFALAASSSEVRAFQFPFTLKGAQHEATCIQAWPILQSICFDG